MATSSDFAPMMQMDPPSDPSATPSGERTLIFLHIPKAAGTTMASILTQHYGKAVSYHTKRHALKHIQTVPEEQRRQMRLVHGHMPFGMHQYLPQPATYFTMLRHPVDRVISHYYFVLNSPGHSGYPVAQAARNIADYVGCGLQEQTNNVQTRHLSGIGGTVGFDECTAHHLEQAKQNLDRAFILAGTSEQFDATLLLLGQRLGWTPSPYPKLNVNPNRRKRDELSRRAIATIERYNALDLELYHYVEQRLQQHIAAQGPEFQQALAAFQQANLEYGEASQPRSRSKPRTQPRPAQTTDGSTDPASQRHGRRQSVSATAAETELTRLRAQLDEATQQIQALEALQERTQQQLRKAISVLARLRRNPLWQLAVSSLRRSQLWPIVYRIQSLRRGDD